MTAFYKGDCIQVIQNHIRDSSIDLIYFNPPFGITQHKWDEKLNWEAFFVEAFRVLKDDGMLVIHCSIPFNYELIRKAPKAPLYSWYWLKERPTNPLIASHQPLRNTEEILVWKKKKTRYYPQRNGEEEREYTPGARLGCSGYYLPDVQQDKKKVKGRLQTHHISMKRNIDEFSTRPIELIELIIKSYTKEGDIILDPTCFKGVSGFVSKQLNRRWIGIDKYFMPSKLMI